MRLRLILLILLPWLWCSVAQAAVDFGMVSNSPGMIGSVQRAQRLAAYLEKQLGEPVTVRSVRDDAELHAWLNRFRAVDLAVLPAAYVERQPAGEFRTLAAVVPVGKGSDRAAELLVARQSLADKVGTRLAEVLTHMGKDGEGRQLLDEMGIADLTAVTLPKPVKTVKVLEEPKNIKRAGGTKKVSSTRTAVPAKGKQTATSAAPAVVKPKPASAKKSPELLVLAEGVPFASGIEPLAVAVSAADAPTAAVADKPAPSAASAPVVTAVAVAEPVAEPPVAPSVKVVPPTQPAAAKAAAAPNSAATPQVATAGRMRVEILAEGIPQTAPEEPAVAAVPPSVAPAPTTPVAPAAPPPATATTAPAVAPAAPSVTTEPAPATVATPSGPGGLAGLSAPTPISLEADQLEYDQAASTYKAGGNVHLVKGATTLIADRMAFNDATSAAQAVGNVHLIDPYGDLRADQVDYNLESGLGTISSGKMFMKEHNFHLVGAEIEKTGEETYQLHDGAFTTCDGDVPSWKFGAKRIDVTMGQYAEARNVFFYLHDLPVLYFPYIAFPVKNERESGLLTPRFGYSNKRGIELSLAYYQVLGRNQDATLYVDYLSDFGVGEGLEYRYLFGDDNEGTFKGYYVNHVKDEYLRERLKEEPELADTLDESDRYAIEWTHWGTLPADWRLSADVEYVSNRDYFDEFGVVAEDYTKDQTESVVLLSRTWQNYILAGELDYTQNLEEDDDGTLQRLPEIRFDALRQRIGETPFYYSLGSSYTYFWREEEDASEDLVNGHRLSVRPAVSAFFSPVDWLDIVPEIGYRERLYQTSSAGSGSEDEGLYDFSTRIGSSFYRIYDVNFGNYKKIRHSIDPEIIYSYIPDVDQEHLPYFDYLDRILPENRVTYALTNRFTARLEPEEGKAEYLEFLYVRLSQSYDFEEYAEDNDEITSDDDEFSDVRAELIFAPIRAASFKLDAYYDLSDQSLDRFNAYAGTHDPDGNALWLNYRYARENSEYSTEGIEYAAGNIALSWFKPFYFGYSQRYDLLDKLTLEKVFDVEYRAQCWSLFLTLRDRLEDQEYMLTFALSGLGNIFKLGGNLGSSSSGESE